jgi:hypothetical protein
MEIGFFNLTARVYLLKRGLSPLLPNTTPVGCGFQYSNISSLFEIFAMRKMKFDVRIRSLLSLRISIFGLGISCGLAAFRISGPNHATIPLTRRQPLLQTLVHKGIVYSVLG